MNFGAFFGALIFQVFLGFENSGIFPALVFRALKFRGVWGVGCFPVRAEVIGRVGVCPRVCVSVHYKWRVINRGMTLNYKWGYTF